MQTYPHSLRRRSSHTQHSRHIRVYQSRSHIYCCFHTQVCQLSSLPGTRQCLKHNNGNSDLMNVMLYFFILSNRVLFGLIVYSSSIVVMEATIMLRYVPLTNQYQPVPTSTNQYQPVPTSTNQYWTMKVTFPTQWTNMF